MIAGVVNHLWQSTLFCGGAWLITLLLRANSAALRHSIWLAASLKFLVPFSLLFLIGSSIGLPAAGVVDSSIVFGEALQSVSVLVTPTSALRAAEPAVAPTTLATLLAIWVSGATFLGLRWFVTWRVADSIVRAARPAATPPDERRAPRPARCRHP